MKRIGITLLGAFLITEFATASATPSDTASWDLTRCIAYAQENNITIKEAHLNKNSATLNLQQSKMNRLPNLSASVSQDFSHQTDFTNSTSLGLSSQVTLFDGFQQTNKIKQGKLLVEQNDLIIEEAKNNITLSLLEAYIQALYFHESIKTIQATIRSSEKELEQAQAKYESGMLAIKDVSDVKSQLAGYRYNLIKTENDYSQQVLTIKQMLELSPEQPFQIAIPKTEQLANTGIPDVSDVYAAAIAIMPDVNSGKQQLVIDSIDLKLAKAGYLPSLSLSAGIGTGYQSEFAGTIGTQFNDGWNESVKLTLSIPIFSKYQNKTQVQSSCINIEKSKLNLTSIYKNLYSKIENVWKNALAYRTEIEASKAALEAAEQSYNLTREQFNFGAVSTTELMQSQSIYISATQSYIQTKYMAMLYEQMLRFYQGKEIKL
ncbi:MAG: hypothetical protein A2W84_13965 [Bacteroidetes bacterium GWC2_40_13]|jgi:outer membrane protein|nr:MAG: hypothetical protein A2W84_13965 [Bacteroidetes bacterium GWC2_40_13]